MMTLIDPDRPDFSPRRNRLRNERGVVLLSVLVVITLLAILITEFTFTVHVDQARARNAIHALQASMLARSGINIAESFLTADEDNKYDAFNEKWYLDMQEFCSGLQVGEGQFIACDVVDESGKLNVNWTRPQNPGKNPTPGPNGPFPKDAYARDAILAIFKKYNVHEEEFGEQLREYWSQELPAIGGASQSPPIPDFRSLEEFGQTFGVPNSKLRKMRNVLTAQSKGVLQTLNVNTAPPEVLNALLLGNGAGDPAAVADILARRDDDPPFVNAADIRTILAQYSIAPEIGQLLGVKSSLYRLRASALTNADTSGERRGGIGQTLTVLVQRRADPNKPRADPNLPGWTLTPLDWQKEGGARLLVQAAEDEEQDKPGLSDSDDRDN